MAQLTLRIADQLASDLKREAARRGESVNVLATHALQALVDPELQDDALERIRERLRRAGLLEEPPPYVGRIVTDEEFEHARAAAAGGRPLSDYVSEGRGPR
jgi:predicted transcriptional regulator